MTGHPDRPPTVATPGGETPVVFTCQGQPLLGIIHHPASARGGGPAVLLIVGGPQYRVGSHRQFVSLARRLAADGTVAMRFDVRGMGDSGGDHRGFRHIGDDIRAAIDCLLAASPASAGVVLWGLCDAASAAVCYAPEDPRVNGLALLNPWVFTEQGAAKTYLKHYYLHRLLSREFWRKVVAFRLDWAASLRSLAALLKQASRRAVSPALPPQPGHDQTDDPDGPLPARMRACWQRFTGPMLLILSGRDLTADEFREMVAADPLWQQLLARPRLTRHTLAAADHTFSTAAWREQVADWTCAWIRSLQ